MQLAKKESLRCAVGSFPFYACRRTEERTLPTVLRSMWRGETALFQHTVLTNHFVKYDKTQKNTVGFYIAENDIFWIASI